MRGTLMSFVVVALFSVPATCFSAIEFDQDVTNSVIYGSGNSNGGFTVDRVSDVELGLRAHRRYPTPSDSPLGIMSQGDGNYGSFEAEGYNSNGTTGGPRGSWNFDWSINTNTDGTSPPVGTFYYLLDIDYNPSAGTSFYSFDPIHVPLADHSFGNNSTADNAGVEAADATEYTTYLNTFNLVQNSWNLAFFPGSPSFDPTADGTYTIRLTAYADELYEDAFASTSINVIVGAGGAPIPEPVSVLAWGGLIGCALVASRRQQRP